MLASCDVPDLQVDPRGLMTAAIFDVLTDLLLLMLPSHLLWKTQISLRNKLILGTIFSLTIFVMAAGIVRNVIIHDLYNLTEFYLWSALEQAIAIVVACIGSYRALFTQDSDSHRLPNYMQNLTKTVPRPGKTSEDLSQYSYPRTTTIIHGPNDIHDHICSFDYSECLLPLNAVRVRQEVIVRPE
ncbi:MAG: hypothetical protein MMC33_006220 [Icmadophila ericetorum]|nr:hypothetical protein [Icmadophila ericetorum]